MENFYLDNLELDDLEIILLEFFRGQPYLVNDEEVLEVDDNESLLRQFLMITVAGFYEIQDKGLRWFEVSKWNTKILFEAVVHMAPDYPAKLGDLLREFQESQDERKKIEKQAIELMREITINSLLWAMENEFIFDDYKDELFRIYQEKIN